MSNKVTINDMIKELSEVVHASYKETKEQAIQSFMESEDCEKDKNYFYRYDYDFECFIFYVDNGQAPDHVRADNMDFSNKVDQTSVEFGEWLHENFRISIEREPNNWQYKDGTVMTKEQAYRNFLSLSLYKEF